MPGSNVQAWQGWTETGLSFLEGRTWFDPLCRACTASYTRSEGRRLTCGLRRSQGREDSRRARTKTTAQLAGLSRSWDPVKSAGALRPMTHAKVYNFASICGHTLPGKSKRCPRFTSIFASRVITTPRARTSPGTSRAVRDYRACVL
eukprot:scaffold47261_cov36-Phaeocystis_antarctica.AAC.1